MERSTRAVCVREIQRTLDQSVKRLLEDKIISLGLEDSGFAVRRDSILTPHGGLIIFMGMQDHTAESIKSLEGFDIAWVEEAQNLSENSLKLLRPTIRKEGSELWFSWNPRKATDPVDSLFRGGEPPPSSVQVKTGYQDNPYLPEELRTELEWDRRRSPELFDHVWDGGYEKKSNATVFKHWRVADFETPPDAQFLLGGDWGFAVDPCALIRTFTRPGVPRTLFVDAERYAIGIEIDDLPAFFDGLLCGCEPNQQRRCENPAVHGWARKRKIKADSARPDTISYMQRHGYVGLEAAKKGPNSVEDGLEFLRGYDIIVHPRCQHVADELTFYSYKVDKQTGEVLSELVDKKNHAIDSMRYAVEGLRDDSAEGGLLW